MEEIKVFVEGKEDSNLTKAVTRFYEIIKDREEPDNPVVNLDSDSKVAKEIYYQTSLIKELLQKVSESQKLLQRRLTDGDKEK